MKVTLKHLNKPLKSLVVSALLLSGVSVLSQQAFAETTQQVVTSAPQAVTTSESKQYLLNNYKLTLSESLTKGEFVNAVNQILALDAEVKENKLIDLSEDSPYYTAANALFARGILTETTLNGDKKLSQLDAIIIAVNASNFKELGFTYPEAKIRAALSKINVSYEQFSHQAAQLLAVAVDTSIISSKDFTNFKANAPISSEAASTLLGKVLDFHGKYKHYLGFVQDDNIYTKVYESYRTQDIISADDLREIFDTALKQELITGYNLKDKRFTPNFDSKLSITYGHSDITHALQLIGLLRSEGVNAKVQLEPKTSAYTYLKAWGEPVTTDDYHVTQIENGNFIAYSKEYDISFEFETVKQKDDFNAIISAYAKKDAEDEQGLIASSWWQPLYYSQNELKEYKVITNNKISKGNYYAQSFSLEELSDDVVAGLKKIDPKVTVESYNFWVDAPFYNYLLGEYK